MKIPKDLAAISGVIEVTKKATIVVNDVTNMLTAARRYTSDRRIDVVRWFSNAEAFHVLKKTKMSSAPMPRMINMAMR